MRNYLLEETYQDIRQPKTEDILTETPTPEQEWLGKNVVAPLQRAIDGLNVARSHIGEHISREEVLKETMAIQMTLDRMLEIWHNIQDKVGTAPPQNTAGTTK